VNLLELKKRFPNAIDSPLPNHKPKRPAKESLGKTKTGETPIMGRIALSLTGFRVRPLDPDGFAGSCKYLIDGCRASGLLPDDDPWTIRLQTEQVKVRSRKEEKTVIRITYP